MRAKSSILLATLVAIPGIAAADERGLGYSAFATVSPLAVYDYPADGHGPSEKGIREFGVGGGASYRVCRWFEVGIGLRYDTAGGPHGNAQFVSLPVTATASLLLGRRQLRAGVGFGPGLGFIPGYAADDGMLVVLGESLEVGIGYAQELGRREMSLLVQLGVRVDVLDEMNADPDWYLDNLGMVNAQMPYVRLGVGWY
jgi:hypothetical protein